MNTKIIAGIVGLTMAQSVFALAQCPSEAKVCGVNPFYFLVVGFSQVCSEKFPENSQSYKVLLAKMIAENPKAYAKVDADEEFQKNLQALQQEFEKLPTAKLANECNNFLEQQTPNGSSVIDKY